MDTTTNEVQEVSGIEYPNLLDRFQSTFIDSVFIIILMFATASLLERYENPPDWIRVVLFFAIWGVYEPLCTTFGFTLGNYIKGIRVRRMDDPSRRINIIQAFFRYLIKISLGWISFLTIHFNEEKRAIHDLAVGSIMIKK
jgi:uncharacterized RDD family membrane protein YckC